MSDDILEAVELTHEQQKAFNRAKRAINDCKKLGVNFQMQDDSLIALNDKHIVDVSEGEPAGEDQISLSDAAASSNSVKLTTPWVHCEASITVSG